MNAARRAEATSATRARRPFALLFLLSAVGLGPASGAGCAQDGAERSKSTPARTGGLTAISTLASARHAALAADARGTLHAVWLDRESRAQPEHLYHAASSDGGASWSAPTRVSPDDPDGYTGIPRLVHDGAGRVFLVWKTVERSSSVAGEDQVASPEYGTLFYRVLENGRWGDVFQVGRRGTTLSFFAGNAPDHTVQVVWSENPGEKGFMTTNADATRIAAAMLDGSGSVEHGEPLLGPEVASAGLGFWGLSGYAEEGSGTHFVAIRGPAGGEGAERVMYDPEQGLRSLGPLKPPANYAGSFPHLLRGADGEDHLVLTVRAGEGSALADLDPSGKRELVLLAKPETGGSVRDFQLTTTPDGHAVATYQLVSRTAEGSVPDLYFSTLADGGAWDGPVRVTRSADQTTARGAIDRDGDMLGATRSYAAGPAAALTIDGVTRVVMVGRQIGTVVHTGQWAAANAESKLYFGAFR